MNNVDKERFLKECKSSEAVECTYLSNIMAVVVVVTLIAGLLGA